MLATRRSSSSNAPKVKELTADEFNALFDSKQAKFLLQQVKSQRTNRPFLPNEQPTLRLYRLLGCPYCARVKKVLDFCRIPYEEVLIDPLDGSGLKDPRYPYAPQLELIPPSSTTKSASTLTTKGSDVSSSNGASSSSNTATGVEGGEVGQFVVNSNDIIRLIAEVCRFDKELTKPEVQSTRQWMGDRFQGVTFAVLAQSWWSAYYGYPALVPEKYRNVVFQALGATALYGLCRLKIAPRLKAQAAATNALSEAEAKEVAQLSADAWLMREAKPFSSRLTPSSLYHGGKAPDIADVEMYAVMSTVIAHPIVGKAVLQNYSEDPLVRWYREMQLREATETPWDYAAK